MRRTVFAAAWVTIGCRATPSPTTPPPMEDRDPIGALALPDAAPITAPDAAPPAPDAAPPPRICTVEDPIHPIPANPPSPMYASVLAANVDGGDTVIVLDRGTNADVRDGWKGILLDDHGCAVPGTDLIIFSAGERIARARTHAPFDQVYAIRRAHIGPP